MKLTITTSETSCGFRIVKSKAVIEKSVKLRIPRRYQKTWNVKTAAPEYVSKEHRNLFESEAARWEAKVMAEIAKANEFSDWAKEQREKL